MKIFVIFVGVYVTYEWSLLYDMLSKCMPTARLHELVQNM